MEQVLSGMDSIYVMLDDVLVTGKTNNEHLHNLEEVFLRFQRMAYVWRKANMLFTAICDILWLAYIQTRG